MSISRFSLVTVPPELALTQESFYWYSPYEINTLLRIMVNDIQKNAPQFSRLRQGEYYVYLGVDFSDVSLISGDELKNFSVEVPTVHALRTRLLKEGISHKEKLAMSQAVEEVYEDFYSNACLRIGTHSHTLHRLCEISSITDDTVFFLLDKVNDRIEAARDLIPNALHVGEAVVAFNLFMEYKSQKRFLKKEIQRRYLLSN